LPTKSANVRGSEEFLKGNYFEASKTMPAGEFISAGINKLTGGLFGTSAESALEHDKAVKEGKTLAERNNNPGNLKYVGQAGATLGEGGFAKFDTVQHGFMALQNQLQLYATGQSQAAGYKKLNTIEDIIKIYAPKSENDTEAYINNLEKLSGHSRKEQLNFSDIQTASGVMSGISKVESGKNLYSPAAINVMITNTTDTNVAVKQLSNR
jgi:hypothetical protein